jgi:hypothetical protein
MAEVQKFTKEEIDQIQSLRDENSTLVSQFGALEVEILIANRRIVELDNMKKDLQQKYSKLIEQEQTFVTELNKKYGTGTVDISSGEFKPAN